MKTAKKFLATATLTAITSLTPSLYAQQAGADVNIKHDRDYPPVQQTQTDLNADRSTLSVSHRSNVRPINKASSLMGMEVINQRNEKLGDIKDVVLDLNSGRISYAVIAVGGFLGLGEKLLAVPTSALMPSATDEKKLVLNADREKIKNAPGFAATNWPDLGSAAWGSETFWTTDTTAPVTDSSGRVYRNDRLDNQSRLDAKSEIYTDAHRDREPASAGVRTDYDRDRDRQPGLGIDGKVRSVDPERRTLTVEKADGTLQDFVFSERPKILVMKGSNAGLVDIHAGYPVHVGYHRDADGRLIAHSVTKIDDLKP